MGRLITPRNRYERSARLLVDGSDRIGTDKTFSNVYEAIKFTTPAEGFTMTGVAIKLKRSASISNGIEFLQAHIYDNDAGEPNVKISSGSTSDAQSVRFGALQDAYQVFTLWLEFGTIALTAATDYWIVLQRTAAPTGGSIVCDSDDTGTDTHAFSADAVSWTLEDDRCFFKVLDFAEFALEVINAGKKALNISIEAGQAFKAHSDRGTAVEVTAGGGKGIDAQSSYDWAGNFTSTNMHAIYALGLFVAPQMMEVLFPGTLIDFAKGGSQSVVGNITVDSGGVVSYNAFRASHFFQLADGQAESDFDAGHVLCITGVEITCEAPTAESKHKWPIIDPNTGQTFAKPDFNPSFQERYSYIVKTTTQADKRVAGVFVEKLCSTADKGHFGENAKGIYLYAAVGLAMVRVTDTGGDIAVGDLLQTSTRAGEAEKQPTDTVKSCTLGKSTRAVTWAGVSVDPGLGYKWKLIAAYLYSG